MNRELRLFIEDFIRSNAHKNIVSGYDLSVGFDLSKETQTDLIKSLTELDNDTIRDLILDHAQNLIDQRMPIVEAHDRSYHGFVKHTDPVNGEFSYHKSGGF